MYSLKKIGFGGGSLSGDAGGYGFGKVDNPERLVCICLERGINYFDTAPIYGFGQSEKILGKALLKKRDDVQLYSKGGISWHSSKRVNLSNDPKTIEKMLLQSLKNLQTDYLDGYYIHYPDPRNDIRYALEVVLNYFEKGVVKAIGLCNTNENDLLKAKELCDISLLQGECNLFMNAFNDLNSPSKTQKVGWGTLDKGILAKSVTLDRKFEKSDARSWAPWWKKGNWKEKVKLLEKYSKEFCMQNAFHYSLSHVDKSLIGIKSEEHLVQVENILSLLNEVEINSNEVADEFRAKL